MNKKYTALLGKRIEKLDEPDFDLEAWKSATISTMEGFLPQSDARIKKINDLKVDYSSWALRDATSKYNPTETCKKKGKEILQAVIDELEIEAEEEESATSVIGILSNHLPKASVKAIESSRDQQELVKILKKEKKDSLANALAEILSV